MMGAFLHRDLRECLICGWTADLSTIINTSKGRPANKKIERHHVKHQSSGGTDTRDNIVNLCSNCHTLVHQKKIESDSIQEFIKAITLCAAIKNKHNDEG